MQVSQACDLSLRAAAIAIIREIASCMVWKPRNGQEPELAWLSVEQTGYYATVP
jgi:hypothetical protein